MGNVESNVTRNEEVPSSHQHGFSPIYRAIGQRTLDESIDGKLLTVRDIIEDTVNKYGSNPGLGTVVVQTQKDGDGKDVETRKIVMNTYRQVYDTAMAVGRCLVDKGFAYKESLYGMRLVGIFSRNRYEWFVTDWACALWGLTTVPLYDTLGTQNLTYVLKQTLMTTMFISAAKLQNLLNLSDIGHLKDIIVYEPINQVSKDLMRRAQGRNLHIVSYEDVVIYGKKSQTSNQNIKVDKNSCYTFSYTSGTTGPPKGAMMSHRNLVSAVAACNNNSTLKINQDDVYVSYLPLPHLMERLVSMALYHKGAQLVISCGNILKLKDDCQAVRPTVFIAVPRILNRIVQGVKTKFAAETGIKKCLIDLAIDSKLKAAKEEGKYTHGFYDLVVFSKVRQGFGGRLRVVVTGSAPLGLENQAYLKAILCCPIVQGYGQTENAGIALSGHPSDFLTGAISQIASGLQVRLADIPQMKYSYQGKDQTGNPKRQGQVWLRGPQVFLGYYKLQDITRDTVTHDGWLKTGDVAEVLPNLSFKIVDRKKNIFKLSQGEYLAPDKIQNVYVKNSLISEIFVHGDSLHAFAIGVIVPNKDFFMKLAEAKKINGSYEQLCRNRQMKIAVLTDINSSGRQAGLNGFEVIKNVYFQTEPFVSRSILTNTMKLIRFEARTYYKKMLDDLYTEGELPLK